MPVKTFKKFSGEYFPPAVTFDGGTDHLTTTPGQGLFPTSTTSPLLTWSVWFRSDSTATGYSRWMYRQNGISGNAIQGGILWSDTMLPRCFWEEQNASGIFSLQAVDGVTENEWHHFMGSVDTTDPAKTHFYVDGVAVAYTGSTSDNGLYHPSNATAQIGTNVDGTTSTYKGDMSELWFGAQYIDLSLPENRAKFIKGSGNGATAVDLGADGSTPTGTAPELFMTGDAVAWNEVDNNSGTGRSFPNGGGMSDSIVPVRVGT